MTENQPKNVLFESLKNIDSWNHVQGKSLYVDDIPETRGTLFASVFGSPVAHGKLISLDTKAAEKISGVVRIFTHNDIPGENEIGGIVKDEPLLADNEVHFQGMPIALVVAESEEIAQHAASLIKAEIEPLKIIVDPREAAANDKLIIPPRTMKSGNSEEAFKKCIHIFEGRADTAGQEHLYIETQGAYAFPQENGSIKIISSTQGPTAVQRTVAGVLDLPMNKIEVDVTRLGGGFGGKEDQASAWAVFVALASYHLKKPVKYILHRMEDMRMTGKRNPYSSDYKIGLDADLNILAFEGTYYQNAGAAADLSPAVLGRTLFHATNSYHIPNVVATGYSCKTNLPPNTAFRGFGGPQGMFVIEAAIHHAAAKIGVPAHVIQQKNLMNDGEELHYGQVLEDCQATSCWTQAVEKYELEQLETTVKEFNKNNPHFKKGLALMPVCFGISFTNTQMNNARALVHVYQDGSVGVSTGAVEMGQGVNTKMVQVASKIFGISTDRIRIESTNTTRVANTSPSAASSTADLNGKALAVACNQIKHRLMDIVRLETKAREYDNIDILDEKVYINFKEAGINWKELVHQAFMKRVNLSAKGHYATPRINFDRSTQKGHPFAYHVFGTAITSVTVDCIRGRYDIDYVKVVHDYGASMNRIVDIGQTEGGIVQGIGWMTMEELMYNEEGRLLSNALSTYKVPDIYSVPKEIDIQFLNTDGNEMAVLKSKAVGEPPLMYGIGAYFAIRNAIKAFSPKAEFEYCAPMTPEKVLMALYELPLTPS